MSLRRNVSLVALLFGIASLAGCSVENTESPSSSASRLTLAGSVGSAAIGTRTFGSVNVDGGSVHVAARELHRRGETGRNVDVVASADGSFRLDVARGARYVITVDDADGHSALVTFSNGSSALSVSANGEAGVVQVGDLRVEGGEARSDVSIDGRFGLAATMAAADEVFEAANGAILEAQAAADEARKAADEALKEAQIASDEALAAAEEAKKLQP